MVRATSVAEIGLRRLGFCGWCVEQKGCIVFLVNDEAAVLKVTTLKTETSDESSVAGVRE